jgi:hypothetical protein
MKNKLWRNSLIASLCVNALAVSVVGYSRLVHPDKVAAVVASKAPETRLVEIEQLKDEVKGDKAISTDSSPGGDDKGSDDGKDDGEKGQDGGSSDSPAGSSHAAKLAALKALKAAGSIGERRQGKPAPIKVNLHSALNVSAKINLTPPKPRVVPSVSGTIDLSKAHINIVPHADPKLLPKNQKPNKIIGKSTSTVVMNGAKTTAQCVGSVGGNTVYASHLKTILGPGVTISGTKFCAPGTGGLPGNGSGNSGPTLQLSKGVGGGGGGNGSSSDLPSNPQQIKAVAAAGNAAGADAKGKGEGPMAASVAKGMGAGTKDAGGQGAAAGGGGGTQGNSQGTTPQDGSGSSIGTAPAAIDPSNDPGQAQLAANYMALAKGPLHGVDDQKYKGLGMGLDTGHGPYQAVINAPHLPMTHGDPGDRTLPGSPTGSGQKRGNVASQPASLEKIQFNPAPVSVGSHSERGTIPWGPDSRKKPKEHGLTGSYYIGRDFQEYHFTRRDDKIDYEWTGQQLDPRLPMGRPFSVRWTGFIKPRYSEVYTIYTTSDDGVRLFINNQLLISNWTIHAATEDVIQIRLEAGHEYPIRLDYFEQTGLTIEVIKLYWESPSQPKEYIPQSCLIPEKG